jgi:hypothetical protein
MRRSGSAWVAGEAERVGPGDRDWVVKGTDMCGKGGMLVEVRNAMSLCLVRDRDDDAAGWVGRLEMERCVFQVEYVGSMWLGGFNGLE